VAVRRFARTGWRGGILIIADDRLAREVYAELFAMRGYGVVTAMGARDGVRLARNRAVTAVVLAVATGAARLRRRLMALRPTVRVHVTGLLPLWFDAAPPLARQQLH
jgi:DNA-binding NtrC family response regulator